MKVSDIGKAEKKIIWDYTLLDCSGSMSGSKFEAAKEGIKANLLTMKEDTSGVDFMVTVIEFEGTWRPDGGHKKYAVRTSPVSDVVYTPGRTGGATPLYGTIADILLEARSKKPKNDPCIITVFTDGQDNSSHGCQYGNPRAIKALIDECVEDNISVKFIGTDFDVEKMIKEVGINRGDTYAHNNTQGGIYMAFVATSNARSSYSKSYAGGASADSLTRSGDFFSKKIVDKDEDKKP